MITLYAHYHLVNPLFHSDKVEEEFKKYHPCPLAVVAKEYKSEEFYDLVRNSAKEHGVSTIVLLTFPTIEQQVIIKNWGLGYKVIFDPGREVLGEGKDPMVTLNLKLIKFIYGEKLNTCKTAEKLNGIGVKTKKGMPHDGNSVRHYVQRLSHYPFFDLGMKVFGNAYKFNYWLHTQNPKFNNTTPESLAIAVGSTDLIEEVLKTMVK